MATPKRTMLSVQAIPDVASIRIAEFRGQEHTVIPVIALVEGVLWPANAPQPELALAEEFGRFPEGWDGSPVVFNHPKNSEGVPIAANSPEVLEDNAFGQIFNTTLDGDKLKSEIWINSELVKNLSEEAQETIANLISGDKVIEVSTGLFTLSEPSVGKFNGEEFKAIWRNIVPDHLAILPEGVVGACSVDDGCGAPRSNKMKPVMRAARLNSNCDCDDVVINDSDDDSEENIKQQKTLLKRILQMAGTIFSFKDNSEGISDRDLRIALDIAIAADENDFIFVMAVFQSNDSAGTVVYEKGFGPPFFERSFTMNTDGGVDLGEDKTAVRPETKFVPINISGAESDSTIQENAMNKDELVNELITNEATQFAEEDREWLASLEEAQLVKLSPTDNGAGDAPSGDAANGDNDNGDTITPVTTEAYIAAAPEDVQEILNESLSLHKERKDALVGALIANARCKFTKEQLEAKAVPELENLASLAVDISYEGAGATLNSGIHDAEANKAPDPPQLFNLDARNDDAGANNDAANAA